MQHGSGGGSGGSVLVSSPILLGNGVISANGGNGGKMPSHAGGGGAGGRILLNVCKLYCIFTFCKFTSIDNAIQVSYKGGKSGCEYGNYRGSAGTVFRVCPGESYSANGTSACAPCGNGQIFSNSMCEDCNVNNFYIPYVNLCLPCTCAMCFNIFIAIYAILVPVFCIASCCFCFIMSVQAINGYNIFCRRRWQQALAADEERQPILPTNRPTSDSDTSIVKKSAKPPPPINSQAPAVVDTKEALLCDVC